MFINILPTPKGLWMNCRCRLVRKFIHCFGASRSRKKIGLSYRLGLWDFFFRARFTPLDAHASLIFSFSVLFHSCCSHAQVFRKTLLHEFLISFSHSEYFLFSDSGTKVHNENPARYGRNTDALVNLNTPPVAEVLAYLHVKISPISWNVVRSILHVLGKNRQQL